MISDFLALSEKVGQLAELTQALRRENAELRQRLIALGEENADLGHRMQEAHKRVALLLEKLPQSGDQQEAA
jgi:cell division protein ZapB